MINQECMIDLETMGTKPGSAVVSIGAVMVDAEGFVVTDKTFHCAISLKSCLEAGLKVDGDTVTWWMQQSDQARASLKDGVPLADALTAFSVWFGERKPVWGNGSDFDNVLLRDAYNALGRHPPWAYWQNRCFRTLKHLRPDIVAPLPHPGAHNALNDAIYQAHHLVVLLLGLSGDRAYGREARAAAKERQEKRAQAIAKRAKAKRRVS